jgi:hypothetical protein
MRAIAQHHQPPRMLYDLALVERPRHVDEIVAIDDGLDAAAFAAIAEKNDRVAPPRSHAAIVPISRGQRKVRCQGGGERRGRHFGRHSTPSIASAVRSAISTSPGLIFSTPASKLPT